MSLLYIYRERERRETPSLYKGESVSRLNREEADSSCIERRECLSSIQRGQRDSFLYKGESVSLLYREERDPFAIQGRECLSYP